MYKIDISTFFICKQFETDHENQYSIQLKILAKIIDEIEKLNKKLAGRHLPKK